MNTQKFAGFTIIELLMVIAIAAVLSAIAVPTFGTMIKNNCMTTNVNDLVSSLHLARSEALKRRTNIFITASNAGVTANEWGAGWTVWQDANSDSNLNVGEEIRVVSLSCSNTTINETANNTATFTYRSNGLIDTSGTLDVCDDRTGETGRQLNISVAGRPNTESNYTGCG